MPPELLAAACAAARPRPSCCATPAPRTSGTRRQPARSGDEWDLRSEDVIRRVLAERTPGIAVLGEEAGEARAPGASAGWSIRSTAR